MSNRDALKAGAARAKKIISGHISVNLQYALDEIVNMVTKMRSDQKKHNMTGNTVNSYAGVLFVDGILKVVSQGQPGSKPLQGKLRKGQLFKKGRIRYDGDTQLGTFKAKVQTDGAMEPSLNLDFLKSYKPKIKGFEIVICNGVEYGTYQESVLDIDVLTGSYSSAASILMSNLKPLPE